ncbi:MAG: hypothetical protein OEY47_01360 [Candidatus Bathyarchaeota archaeon]|nr:hypothetical protein [Candidatus Bathyarchaeota archaeon]
MSETQKSDNRTPIMVSIQLHGRLNTLKDALEKIVGKSLSMEKTIDILLIAKPLDVIITEMVMELYPPIEQTSTKAEQIDELENKIMKFLEDEWIPNKIPKGLKEAIKEEFFRYRVNSEIEHLSELP